MTKPAAFQACFTDWRLVKGRKVIQIVFEVPLEAENAAYQALGGMPDPGASVWCAIARLQQAVGEARTDSPAKEAGLHSQESAAPSSRLAQQAGIACKDPRFWKFLTENDMPIGSEHDAIVAVRFICSVPSRREITPATYAGNRWDELYGKYLAWRDAPDAAA